MVKASDYRIIIPDRADVVTRCAAGQLRDFIGVTSGIWIDVFAEGEARLEKSVRYFSIGKTRALKKAEILPDEKTLNYYGFIRKSVGNILYIAGARDRGGLYGVFDYAEQVLGIRFIAPDETFMPAFSGDFFPESDVVSVPAFRLRSYLYGIGCHEDPVYVARKRFNNGNCQNIEYLGGNKQHDFYDDVHNTLKLVRPAVWQKKHPEFYETDANGRALEICYTNGITDDGKIDRTKKNSVAKILIRNLKRRILENTTADFFMVGQSDGDDICKCSRCRAIQNTYGAPSAAVVRLLNAAAKELVPWAKKRGRDINLVFFAYASMRMPPALKDETTIPGEGVYVRLAIMTQNYIYPVFDARQALSDKSFREIGDTCDKNFAGWAGLGKRFMIWEYAANFFEPFWRHECLRNINENIAYYKKIGADYVMYESDTNNPLALLNAYVAAKALWDGKADVAALTEEFCGHYYKAGAPFVLEFLREFDKCTDELAGREKGFGSFFCLMGHGAWVKSEFYRREFLEKLAELICCAERAVTDSALKIPEKEKVCRRLKYLKLTPLRMLLFNAKDYYGELSAAKGLAEEFCGICEEFGFISAGIPGVIPENGLEYGHTVSRIKELYGIGV
jgi:hypothetical protein